MPCAALYEDEQHLLYAAGLAQAGENDFAEQTLRAAMLST
jgi:hypothetical protein